MEVFVHLSGDIGGLANILSGIGNLKKGGYIISYIISYYKTLQWNHHSLFITKCIFPSSFLDNH